MKFDIYEVMFMDFEMISAENKSKVQVGVVGKLKGLVWYDDKEKSQKSGLGPGDTTST